MAKKTAELKIEDALWQAADQLRGSMDASQYRNVVLGLIFLKYVSDSFNEKYESLINSDYPEDAEDRDMYTAENIFWLPKEARWDVIASAAKTPEIGETIDKAMEAIERENDQIKGVLPKNYASPDLDKVRLGGVMALMSRLWTGFFGTARCRYPEKFSKPGFQPKMA